MNKEALLVFLLLLLTHRSLVGSLAWGRSRWSLHVLEHRGGEICVFSLFSHTADRRRPTKSRRRAAISLIIPIRLIHFLRRAVNSCNNCV